MQIQLQSILSPGKVLPPIGEMLFNGLLGMFADPFAGLYYQIQRISRGREITIKILQ